MRLFGRKILFGEEKRALEVTVRLSPHLIEISELFLEMHKLIKEAVRSAKVFLMLEKERRDRGAGKYALFRRGVAGEDERFRRLAKAEYGLFKTNFLRLRHAVDKADGAIKLMEKQVLPEVSIIEKYSKDLLNKIPKGNLPEEHKQTAEEQSILSYSKNSESAVRLNIQRTTAIRDQLEEALKEFGELPLLPDTSQAVEFSKQVFEKLEPFEAWTLAAFNSLHHFTDVIHQIAQIEGAVLKQQLMMRK